MSKKLKGILIITAIVIFIVSATIYANYNKGGRNLGIANGSTNSAGKGQTPSTSKSDSIVPPYDTGIVSQESYDKQDPTKIIKKSNVTMQTDNYVTSLKNINNLIKNSSAMIVRIQENQGNTYEIVETSDKKYRSIDMIIKVPKDNFDNLNTELKKTANVISYYEEAQDISSTYSDIEAKIQSYTLQEAQLNDLLKKATTAKDLLEISNQIQNVIQQREYLQRQKNSYDNQIEYSTITLRLTEVQSVEIKEKNMFNRMKDAFQSSLSQMKEMGIAIVMFIVYTIPYLILFLIIVLIIYCIIKLSKKKK
ncbi:MAG: DUF4349 domain-containing protein [Clostridia bacterium]|nr:DUF4349 domain-containing protein [Clostridia bacterium]